MALVTSSVGRRTASGKARDQEVSISGLTKLTNMSRKIAPKVARRLARGTVHKIAGQMRNEMRRKAPKDDGTLRKAIHTKRRRGTPTMAVSDVRIAKGRNAKHDAWYWHFVEFGTVRSAAQPFIAPTITEFEPKIPRMMADDFGKRLKKELNKQARKQGVKR